MPRNHLRMCRHRHAGDKSCGGAVAAVGEGGGPVSRPRLAGSGRALSVLFRLAAARKLAGAGRLRARELSECHAAACGRAGLEPPHLRGLQIRPRRHHRHDAAGGSGGETPRSLPGLRAPCHRVPALARTGGALCERLSAHPPAGKQGTVGGRGRLARLVRGVLS